MALTGKQKRYLRGLGHHLKAGDHDWQGRGQPAGGGGHR